MPKGKQSLSAKCCVRVFCQVLVVYCTIPETQCQCSMLVFSPYSWWYCVYKNWCDQRPVFSSTQSIQWKNQYWYVHSVVLVSRGTWRKQAAATWQIVFSGIWMGTVAIKFMVVLFSLTCIVVGRCVTWQWAPQGWCTCPMVTVVHVMEMSSNFCFSCFNATIQCPAWLTAGPPQP